jgi:hypothetical protein
VECLGWEGVAKGRGRSKGGGDGVAEAVADPGPFKGERLVDALLDHASERSAFLAMFLAKAGFLLVIWWPRFSPKCTPLEFYLRNYTRFFIRVHLRRPNFLRKVSKSVLDYCRTSHSTSGDFLGFVFFECNLWSILKYMYYGDLTGFY